ncbi:MAG: penicillin-binding protein 1C [Proteobacteria bacterium]|nr:penicillin-binding protein 1C [Pseudomonadota bacterium]
MRSGILSDTNAAWVAWARSWLSRKGRRRTVRSGMLSDTHAAWAARARPWLLPVVGLVVLAAADHRYPATLSHDGYASVVVSEEGIPLRRFADGHGVWRYPVTIADVSPLYLEALLGYEDQWFYYHPGINPVSLARAAWDWLRQGQVVSGGSTLTMQVARLRYPHSRSVAGKVYQMARALQIEWRYSKHEILTWYLNHAPFGGTLEGVEAASRSYFGYPARVLTHAQAALLAVLPQAPSRYRPDRHPDQAQRARDKLLDRMVAQQIWTAEVASDAGLEQVLIAPVIFNTRAPLLSRRLRYQSDEPIVRTFIDYDLQSRASELVRDHARITGDRMSAAALVMENSTGKVRAYLGSADFDDLNRFGHVDMVQALRSPGSAFKPFIYGMALDDGILHSETLLYDAPIRFGDYFPENFNRRFSGPVSATDALQRSLNVAAVQVLDQVGPMTFYARLTNAGISVSLPDGARPNLAMALGGFASSLADLVQTFSALGHGGESVLPRYSGADPPGKRRIISAGSAWIVGEILRTRPDNHLPGVAVKTGTSYGFRDSWAVGVSADHTVGVWLGRPDNKPVPGHYGAVTAVPLMARLFGLIPDRGRPPPRPESVTRAEICWPSGSAYRPGCDIKRQGWVLDNTVAPTPFHHQSGDPALFASEIMIRVSDKGLRVPLGCDLPGESKHVLLWPPALEPWIPESWRRHSRVPDVDPDCFQMDGLAGSGGIEIVGVDDGHRYRSHGSMGSLPPLRLTARGAATPYYWFVNGQLQSSISLALDLELVQRRNQIVLLDQLGQMAMVEVFNDAAGW